MLNRLEFDDLVQNLERRYENRPLSLQRSTIAWMLLGSIFLGVALIASIAVLYGLISFYLTKREDLSAILLFGFFPAYIAWSILRGWLVVFPPPKGVRVTSHDSPELFQMIHEIATSAGGINFHKVLITDDFNAAVCHRRMWKVGPRRRYLLLGFPLLDSLSPEEFRTVIAHEFHHLSPSHTRASRWIHGRRARWEIAAEALSKEQFWGSWLFRRFFNWFWPQIHARIAILQRQMEYECDAFSSSVTDPTTVGNALLRCEFTNSRVAENFWENIGRRAHSDPHPPKFLFDELGQFIREPIHSSEYARWLDQALKFAEGTADSHPTLKRRLNAVGASYSPYDLPRLQERASESFLGTQTAEKVRQELNRLWFNACQHEWSEAHHSSIESQKSVSDLGDQPTTRNQKWASLVQRIDREGFSSLKKELFSWVAEHPDHFEAKYVLGAQLMAARDASGIPLLEEVIKYRTHLTLDCLDLLSDYYQFKGEIAEHREIRRRADQFEVDFRPALALRRMIDPSDVLLPHQFGPEELDHIISELRRHPEIQQAWLVRLEHQMFPEWPHYTMIVKMKLPRFKLVFTPPITRIFGRLYQSLMMEGSLLLVDLKTWKKRSGPLPDHMDSLIYEKGK